MASYEAIYGWREESFDVQMKGLKQMPEMRGGLASLGQGRLLGRICFWIDFNASYIYNTPRHFREESLIPAELEELFGPEGFCAFR